MTTVCKHVDPWLGQMIGVGSFMADVPNELRQRMLGPFTWRMAVLAKRMEDAASEGARSGCRICVIVLDMAARAIEAAEEAQERAKYPLGRPGAALVVVPKVGPPSRSRKS